MTTDTTSTVGSKPNDALDMRIQAYGEACIQQGYSTYTESTVRAYRELRGYIEAQIEAARTATEHALAAGPTTAAPAQPAAQQGVVYAEPPTSNYAGRVYEEGFLIGTRPLYTADQLRAFADRTHALRAAHGQAPATQQAGIPGNFITHRSAWREALETAKFFSMGDDRSYWDHELAAFDRSFDRLWTLMQDAPNPSTTAQEAESVPATEGSEP